MPKLLLVSTTTWPTAARLAAGFSDLDWTVEIMAPAGAPVRASRYAATCHGYSPFAPQASLKGAVVAAAPDLIIPCDDRVLGQLLRLRETAGGAIAETIVRSLGAPEAYGGLTARADFIAAAEAEGICVPQTRSLESEADLERGLAELGFPAVLKSDGSWGGAGVAIVHSREEARAAFHRMSRRMPIARALLRALRRREAQHLTDALAAPAPRLSLQAHIDGAPATTAFACWQGEVLATIHGDVMSGAEGTGPASVVRIVSDAAMQAAVVKLARRFKLSGLHGLDFIRDREGRVHLLEINPRATQTAAFAMGEGHDLVAALAARVSSEPARQAIVARSAAISGDLVALFPQEWLRDPTSAWFARAHHDVPWDDPALIEACLAPARKGLFRRRQAGLGSTAAMASLPLGNQAAIASKP